MNLRICTLLGTQMPVAINAENLDYVTPGLNGNGTTVYLVSGAQVQIEEGFESIVGDWLGGQADLQTWKQNAPKQAFRKTGT
jgi:hypothetical protein